MLTLKEDILTRCAPPGLVGSSIRANYVGLNKSDARKADDALAAVVYLHLFLSQFRFLPVFFILFFGILLRHTVRVKGANIDMHKDAYNFDTKVF